MSQFVSVQETKANLRDLETALSLYEAHNGRFPTTEQTLSALIKLPNKGDNYENWKGPYLRNFQIPSDGWGRPFNYTSDGTRYVILSWEQTERMVARVPMLTFQHLGNCIGVEMLTIKPPG